MKPKRAIKRHPQVIAWEKWRDSLEGKAATNPDTLGTTISARNYLENRLQNAFNAGAKSSPAVEALRKMQACPNGMCGHCIDVMCEALDTMGIDV
jgi:hypothetical protein